MKKTLLSFFTALLCCMTLHAQAESVNPVLGTYNCDLYLSIGQPIDSTMEAIPNKSVSVEPGEKAGTITFALRQLELEGLGNLGDIILPNIGVNKTETGYQFAENTPIRLALLGGVIQADVNINHTTSYVEGDKLYADVDIFWIMDPSNEADKTPIYVRVISNKKDLPTAIESVVAPSANASAVYNLSGIRVADRWNNNLPKGVYVVNGKKVIK